MKKTSWTESHQWAKGKYQRTHEVLNRISKVLKEEILNKDLKKNQNFRSRTQRSAPMQKMIISLAREQTKNGGGRRRRKNKKRMNAAGLNSQKQHANIMIRLPKINIRLLVTPPHSQLEYWWNAYLNTGSPNKRSQWLTVLKCRPNSLCHCYHCKQKHSMIATVVTIKKSVENTFIPSLLISNNAHANPNKTMGMGVAYNNE